MSETPDRAEDRDAVSLAPLTPEEALRALLAVDPDDEPNTEQDEPENPKDDEAPTE